MYTINYDRYSGKPINISKDGNCIPIEPLNRDFRKFLAWNAKQKKPLDYETPIEPTPPEPQETMEERLKKE